VAVVALSYDQINLILAAFMAFVLFCYISSGVWRGWDRTLERAGPRVYRVLLHQRKSIGEFCFKVRGLD